MSRIAKAERIKKTGRLSGRLGLAIALLVAGAAPARGFNIDFTYEPGITDDQITAVEMAGLAWETYLKDDINLDMHVGRASDFDLEELDLGTDILGVAIPGFAEKINYTTALNNLVKDKKSNYDKIALNNLTGDNNSYDMMVNSNVTSENKLQITYANAMAGSQTTKYNNKLHGAIVFNDSSNINWNYDDEVAEDEADLVSTIAHEIGHNLGFVSGLSTQGQENEFRSSLDLYRYSEESLAEGAIEFTKGKETFFCIDCADGSGTAIPGANGIDEGASHWFEGVSGLMEGHNLFGERLEAEKIDLIAMDVIGYDLTGKSKVDWAVLRTQAEGKVDDAVIEERVTDVEAMIDESGFTPARPAACPPFCGQEASAGEAAQAKAVPEPGMTTGLLGLGLVGVISSLFKRGKKG
ncbi:MAG: NF038122 family metalloprotease [Gomphosphaeria aponina SAG 52.96 = DSM 107014]|uniref:NF038122 family metalloprotease n=1 Tax=Gomphosphaeria aponina SAG 52.96 = DSM 107014 TaxID=1521640 RepID=A0A941GXK4_9CHRO|nr:NF038122 family metalloprotease [Gomphosphaeria aponina SAG 52.96 = DSM 107014]